MEAHGGADVSLLQRGRILHAIACHGHHVASRPQCPYQTVFLVRSPRCKHVDGVNDSSGFVIRAASPSPGWPSWS